jgi:hypothetical protein
MDAPPAGRRSRPRRGSPARPVSARIYRTTWALAVLPLLVTAFTVARPEPLPGPDLPPTFDAAAAATVARDFARTFPDRAPGGANAREATTWVAEQLRVYALDVEEQRFTAELPGRGRVELVNLVATPLAEGPQRSAGAIVVMADRDNLGLAPGLDRNASGTAALIELARELSTVSSDHAIVFVSTDGGAWGSLGAVHLAEDETFAESAIAVVDLDSVGGEGRPRLELVGESSRSPAAALAATADASVLEETGERARHASGLAQLVDLAFPLSLYGQSPLLGAGISALTLSADGPRPPGPTDEALSQARLGEIGRATQALVVSLDRAAEPARGTESYVYLGGRALRGFAVQFFLVVATLPVLLATVDLLSRLRRRGLALAPAFRSLRSRLAVWLWAGGLAALFTVLGIFPNGEPRPLPPDLPEAQQWPFAALATLVGLSGVGWLLARARLVPRERVERSDELAGHLVAMLALCTIAVAVAVVNAYALLFVLPALHAWLWAPHARDAHPVLRGLLFAAGLAGPVALLVSMAVRLELGFDAPWYLATLFTVGYVPLGHTLLVLCFGAVAAQVAAVLFGRYAPYPMDGERPARGVVRESIARGAGLVRRR